MTSYSREFGGFYLSAVRCAVKKQIHLPQAATSSGFPHLDRIGKSANLFSANAIICEIADFMTSNLKNRCS